MDLLELTAARRPLARGLGPARQSKAFDPVNVAAHMAKTPCDDAGAPLFPGYAVLLGALWALREIGVAWATRADIAIDEVAMEVVWTLPVSKTDPQTKACARTWGCMCVHLAPGVCPFHNFVEYRQLLKDYFKPPLGVLKYKDLEATEAPLYDATPPTPQCSLTCRVRSCTSRPWSGALRRSSPRPASRAATPQAASVPGAIRAESQAAASGLLTVSSS